MKTASNLRRTGSALALVRAARNLVWWLGAVAICAACHTERTAVVPGPAPAKGLLAQLEPGIIVLTARPQTAAISFDPPSARVESAREGAATAARRVLDTPHLGNPYLEAAVGVGAAAAAPFAAAYGAVRSSRQRLAPDELSKAEQNLVQAMKANAGAEYLRDQVAEAARQKTSRWLMCATSVSNVLACRLAVSATLEVAVEQLNLRAEQNEHHLYMAVRARLLRGPDGAVLLERAYSYQSGSSLFIDWTRLDALNRVAQSGYQSLAEVIAGDIFQPAAEPPLLIGPGQKHSVRLRSQRRTAGKWRPHAAAVRCRAPLAEAPGHAASAREADARNAPLPAAAPNAAAPGARSAAPTAATIEVYTGPGDERLRSPRSSADSVDSPDAQTDTEAALDGLESDRNAVVQFAACLGAVPLGLWEQTAGAALKAWRSKTDKLAEGLDALPEREHFGAVLADEVARHLRAQGLNQVLRTEESPRFPLAVTNGVGVTTPALPPASTNSQLALQVQVVNAQLIGKHRHSRSRALCVEVQTVVIRTSDGQELYSRPIHYRSSPRKLKDWAAADSRLFREELAACSRQTAQALAGELIARGFVAQAK